MTELESIFILDLGYLPGMNINECLGCVVIVGLVAETCLNYLFGALFVKHTIAL